MVGTIILAAGDSVRMGRPKALLMYRGETFLEGILRAAYAAGVERRVVVLGVDQDKILSTIDLGGVEVVRSAELGAGPIGSIRAGVRRLINHPVESALVWPVDRPHVLISTIQAVIAAFRADDKAIAIPVHDGRRGHPVLFGRAVFSELLTAPDDLGARAVVRADPARVLAVPVFDPAVLDDLNTPEQYQALLRREDQYPADP